MTSEVSPLAEGHWELSPGPSRKGRTTNWACSGAKSLGKGPVRMSPSGEGPEVRKGDHRPSQSPHPVDPFITYHPLKWPCPRSPPAGEVRESTG